MTADHRNDCLLCGAPLEYLPEPAEMECAVCHRRFQSSVRCAAGHFVCDACHARNAVGVITELCRASRSRDPIALMTEAMRQPSVHLHGPEHHVLVGAALLAAYRNCGGPVEDFDRALGAVVFRGKQVPGGACGYWGCCGAAVSAGIFVSAVTGASPLSGEAWGLANRMTSRALEAIGAMGGPRCCKRDAYAAALAAVDFTREQLGVAMEVSFPVCSFFPLNQQCIGRRCPYFPPAPDQDHAPAHAG